MNLSVDGRRLVNCDEDPLSMITPEGWHFGIEGRYVYYHAAFSVTVCEDFPDWSIGKKFNAGLNPTPSDLGWDGDETCVNFQ